MLQGSSKDVVTTPLHQVSVPSKLWSSVGIELVGTLSTTQQGNKYIVANYRSVLLVLFGVVCKLGCMDYLISDQGREFVNQVVECLAERRPMLTEHRISFPYHPQTNDQRERDNTRLKDSLNKPVNDDATDWDTLIQITWCHICISHVNSRLNEIHTFMGDA